MTDAQATAAVDKIIVSLHRMGIPVTVVNIMAHAKGFGANDPAAVDKLRAAAKKLIKG